jgi:hypothetical protein
MERRESPIAFERFVEVEGGDTQTAGSDKWTYF